MEAQVIREASTLRRPLDGTQLQMATGSSRGGTEAGESRSPGSSARLRTDASSRSDAASPTGSVPTQPVVPADSPFLSFHPSFFTPLLLLLLPAEELRPQSSPRLTNTNIPTKEMQSASLSLLTSRLSFLKRYAPPPRCSSD